MTFRHFDIEPTLLVGTKVCNIKFGVGTVIRSYEENGTDYVAIQFDRNESATEFRVDVVLDSRYFQYDHAMLREISEESANYQKLMSRGTHSCVRRKSGFSDDDLRLCLAWAGRNPSNFSHFSAEILANEIGGYEAGRLISARMAELIVIDYYRALGFTVTDISVAQIKGGQGERWKDFDLLVGDRPVDVKNARRSFNSPNGYVEHCIPRFKSDRLTKNEVVVVGVLSDYKHPNELLDEVHECTVLGEARVTNMRALYRWMHQRYGNIINLSGLWVPNYQPGWAFEYPLEHYHAYVDVQASAESMIGKLIKVGVAPKDLPPWLLPITKSRFNLDDISSNVREIIGLLCELRDTVGLTRPSVYIFVMVWCLDALIHQRPKETVFQALRMTVFSPTEALAWLIDPVGHIRSLVAVLEIVYDQVVQLGFQFISFKLSHPSVLRGQLAVNRPGICRHS